MITDPQIKAELKYLIESQPGNYSSLPGGVKVMIGDEFVGAIGLSGAFSGYQDEHCAWRGFVENEYYGPY